MPLPAMNLVDLDTNTVLFTADNARDLRAFTSIEHVGRNIEAQRVDKKDLEQRGGFDMDTAIMTHLDRVDNYGADFAKDYNDTVGHFQEHYLRTDGDMDLDAAFCKAVYVTERILPILLNRHHL